jgi:hypothetical protein
MTLLAWNTSHYNIYLHHYLMHGPGLFRRIVLITTRDESSAERFQHLHVTALVLGESMVVLRTGAIYALARGREVFSAQSKTIVAVFG